MTDFLMSTGSTGTMMIRDTGTYVEFWIKAGTQTRDSNMPWGYTINGVTNNSNAFNFTTSGIYQRVGSWNVTTEQTVTFRLFATGTLGLGGPTTLSAFIDRTRTPDAPTAPTIGDIWSTGANLWFQDGPNGGSPITSRQIGYGTYEWYPNTIVNADPGGPWGTITGLTPGTTYWTWARTINAEGYGTWSTRTPFTTIRVPDAPSAVILSAIKQTTLTAQFSGNGNGGSPILEWQVAYGPDPNTASIYVTSWGTNYLTNLGAGQTYYFWARGRNAVGWGPWSPRVQTTMIPGAHIQVGNTIHNAVPYVKVAGVWKAAIPFVKLGGIWRETT